MAALFTFLASATAGFYVLDVADVDTDVDWTQRIPTAKYGKVEIRRIVEYSS